MRKSPTTWHQGANLALGKSFRQKHSHYLCTHLLGSDIAKILIFCNEGEAAPERARLVPKRRECWTGKAATSDCCLWPKAVEASSVWRALDSGWTFTAQCSFPGQRLPFLAPFFPCMLCRNPAGLGALHIIHPRLSGGGTFTIDRSFTFTTIDSLVLKFCFLPLTP